MSLQIHVILLIGLICIPVLLSASPLSPDGKTAWGGAPPPFDAVAKPVRFHDDSSSSGGNFVPLYGTHPVVVILVEFADTPGTYSNTAWREHWFGETQSVSDYYDVNSRGMFSITPAEESFGINDGVIGWVMSGSEYWGDSNHPFPDGDDGDDLMTRRQIAYNAMVAADPYINFAKYDWDGNGHISVNELHVAIVVAGFDRAGSRGSAVPSVWAHHGSLYNAASLSDLKLFRSDDGVIVADYYYNGGYVLVGEKHKRSHFGPAYMATMGASCHEFGHDLGLLDLYNTETGASVIGDIDLMDSGNWNGVTRDGDLPCLLSLWNRAFLGWDRIERLDNTNQSGTYQIRAASEPDGITPTGFALHWGHVSESFMLENRIRSGYDAEIPGEGIVIYHVDEDILGTLGYWEDGNAAQTEDVKAIRVEEANNDWDIPSNEGEAGDFYSSSTNSSFSTTSAPSSDDNTGNPSMVEVTNISAAQSTMEFMLNLPAPEVIPPGHVHVSKNHPCDITVTWEPVPNASAYALFRANSGDNREVYTLVSSTLTSTTFTETDQCGNCGGTANLFLQNLLYRVKAKINGIWSEMSPITDDAVGWIMGQPDWIIPSYKLFPDKIIISWCPVEGANHYDVFRTDDPNNNISTVDVIGGTENTWFEDTTAEVDTPYYYWIRPKSNEGIACYLVSSAPVQGQRGSDAYPLVSGITATQGMYPDQIYISWIPQSGIAGYRLFRDTESDGSFSHEVTSERITDNAWMDSEVEANQTYYYKVELFDMQETSLGISDDYGEGYCIPAVEGILAADNSMENYIEVVWDAYPDAQEYFVYRGNAPDGRFSLINRTTDTVFQDSNVTDYQLYYYTVTCITSTQQATPFGASDRGNIYLQSPLDFTVTQGGAGTLVLSWSEVSYATGYHIYRAIHEDGPFEYFAYTDSTTYNNTGLAQEQTYYYKLRTIRGENQSDPTEIVYGITSAEGALPQISISTMATPPEFDTETYPVIPYRLVLEAGSADVWWKELRFRVEGSDTELIYLDTIYWIWDKNENGTYETSDPIVGEYDSLVPGIQLKQALDPILTAASGEEVTLFASFKMKIDDTLVWVAPLDNPFGGFSSWLLVISSGILLGLILFLFLVYRGSILVLSKGYKSLGFRLLIPLVIGSILFFHSCWGAPLELPLPQRTSGESITYTYTMHIEAKGLELDIGGIPDSSLPTEPISASPVSITIVDP
jgi:M6 family metalloprotease-like protein